MRTRLLTALLFTALLAPAAPALTIDNFEEGGFTVTDPGPILTPPTFGEQSGLSPSNVVGGVRLVRSQGEGSPGSATAALTTTGGDDGVSLSATIEGNFALIYDGVAGGTSNGTAGTLNLDLSTSSAIEVSISTPIPTGADMRLTMWDATGSRTTAFRPVVNGVNTIALTGGLLLLDLTDIKAIQIALQEVGPATGLTIYDISAVPVPEPTTAVLLSLGLAGIAVARRR
jgi:hypothetical protein